jgi:glycosyltransferase involved in cell wall biosynthesis
MILTSMKTAAVIPAFNEESAIGSVVLKTRRYVDDVFVVDDGSTDSTALTAELAGAKVIRIPLNSGYSNALITGLKFVRSNGYSAAIMLDADGQHDPNDGVNLLAPILSSEADLVIGSRFLSDNDIPFFRTFGIRILNIATNLGAKKRFSDSQSGFRALGKKALDNIDLHSNKMNIASDMIMHFTKLGLRIKEVPITVEYDVPNQKKRSSIAHGISVLNGIVGFIGYRRPLLVFGIPAFIMFIGGSLIGLLSSQQIYLFGWGWLFQSLAWILLIIVGTMLGIAALTLNYTVALMKVNKEAK